MFFEPVEKLQMNQPGKSLLKSIQDKKTPLADLLVRESVQNSTDAAKDGVDKVIVDFSAGKFDAQAFSSHLDGIKEKLLEYYPETSYDFLCIRDWNTRGLGGRIIRTTASEIQNDDSFTKLVYGVGYSQEQSGAGGSWGLGKTVYYSVGNGIVLYYSRFKEDGEDGGFVERLAVCLIEDHEKHNALSKGKSCNGVAWWGVEGENGTSVPVTDHGEIVRILSCFDKFVPYEGDETGTAVIIPYVSLKELCPKVEADFDSETDFDEEEKPPQPPLSPWWCEDLMEYLKISVQKWYAPRLLNSSFARPYLEPHFNGNALRDSDVLPFFKAIRELYQKAMGQKVNDADCILNDSDIHKEDILLRKIFDQTRPGSNTVAGWFAVARISEFQLRMTPPVNNPSPCAFINNVYNPADENHQIIVYTRGPGMILEYPTKGKSLWLSEKVDYAEGDYIVGIFAANTKQLMTDGVNFGDYLRNLELANHATWADENRVVQKIQSGVKKVLRDLFQKRNAEDRHNAPQDLRNYLADKLLPGMFFGGAPTAPSPSPASTTGRGEKKTGFSIIAAPDIVEEDNNLFLVFRFKLSSKNSKETVSLAVAAGREKLVKEKWVEKTGLAFPLEATTLSVEKCIVGKERVGKRDDLFPVGHVDASSFVFESQFEGKLWQIEGTLKMRSSDAKVSATFELEPGEE